MLRTSVLAAAMVTVASVAGGCGNGNGNSSTTSTNGAAPTLGRTQYTQRLHAIASQEAAAQLSVQKAMHASSVAELRKVLSGFVNEQRAIGRELAALRPPADAVSANRQLAKGFGDNATATQQALTTISHATSAKAALATLSRSRAAQSSGQEIDSALRALKKLGYTKGS